MTDIASLRETLLRVIRIVRVLVVLQVTRYASRLRQVVIVVDVAVCALARWNRVLGRQRETRFRMVKLCRRPGARRVAHFASLRETLLDVVRIGGALVVLQVARDARGLRQLVIVVDVAIRALPWWNGVLPGQWEARFRVIESRR